MYQWLDKLKEGKRYEITIAEEGTFTGEYRGYANDPEWEDFIIFWVDGDSKGSLFYLGDIEGAKVI